MVDYVAVLRRTIDALPKNTPEIRERVYTKARTTVQSKLAMITPPPSQALIAKQMSGLEAAIATLEADFAPALEVFPEPNQQLGDPFDDIFNARPDDNTPVKQYAVEENQLSQTTRPYADGVDDVDQSSLPARGTEVLPDDFPEVQPVNYQTEPSSFPEAFDRQRLPETATLEFPGSVEQSRTQYRAQDNFDDVFGDLPPLSSQRETNAAPSMPTLDEPVVPPIFTRSRKPKAKLGRILVPLLGLAVLGGLGAFAWIEREQIVAALQPDQAPAAASQPETPNPAVAPAVPETAATPVDSAANGLQKFTQRLNADGTEVDAGAGTAGGEQSVAQLEPAAEAPASPENPATPAVEAPVTAPAASTTQTPVTPVEAMPVGQKAIFYEERTSGAEGSARVGAVVWSVVRESPGNDRPPEPAIRGELSIPDAGLNVRMTLRRNADATLPASHILELIMSVPENFEGGTIEDVQRVNLKPTEENAGVALAATPVKVADKFFLVALENTPAAQEVNLALLRDQSWIDLPVVYRTGRRALFTMEKGLVGDQVFKQVLDAWVAAPLQ